MPDLPALGWVLAVRRSYSIAVDRLFSMFPQNATNSGLVLLRFAAAASLHLDASGHLVLTRPDWQFGLLCVCSVALVVGFLTPLFAGVVAVMSLTLVGEGAGSFVPVVRAVNAIALALLGPGSYSLDAKMFGPRTVVMTMHREPDDPK